MEEIVIAGLRDDAKNHVEYCEAHRFEDEPEAVAHLDRALVIAKVQALVSISGELELIRKHLQHHGIQPEFKTSD